MIDVPYWLRDTCLLCCYKIITYELVLEKLFVLNCVTETGKQLRHETRRYLFVSSDFTVFYNLWSDHVLGRWKHRNDPNVSFLKYEDMKKVCHTPAGHSTA